MLNDQGLNAVVSVIAPLQLTRDNVTELINPFWIYIRGGMVANDMPYEIPENSDLTIDPPKESLLASLETIIKKVGSLSDII